MQVEIPPAQVLADLTPSGKDLVLPLTSFIPRTPDQALRSLRDLREEIFAVTNAEGILDRQAWTNYIKRLFRHVHGVRREAEVTFLTGEHRIGQLLRIEQEQGREAVGIRMTGRDSFGGFTAEQPNEDIATVAEKVGGRSRTYSWRLKKLALIDYEALVSAIDEIHMTGKEATLSGVLKVLATEGTRTRRLGSLTAPPIESGMDLRIGDCRVMLTNIADASIPLILTDPPYGDAAEPLYRWLAQWAERVLIPGGSLVCYTGQARLNRDMKIFDECLTYWWTAVMLHDVAQRLAGKFVIPQYKPVLWYVKEYRRGRTLVPDVLNATRDKSEHAWAQGDGGVRVWIHHLSEPGEIIVDPFAGTARWGEIAIDMGRRWIGSDIAHGGTETVVATDPVDVGDDQATVDS
jgi:hypothetical protein